MELFVHSVLALRAMLVSAEAKLYIMLLAKICNFAKSAFGQNRCANVLRNAKVGEQNYVLCTVFFCLGYTFVNEICTFIRELSVGTIAVEITRNIEVYERVATVRAEERNVCGLFTVGVFGVPKLFSEKSGACRRVVISLKLVVEDFPSAGSSGFSASHRFKCFISSR